MTLGICSANLSIGIYSWMSRRVSSIVNNRVIGISGKHVDEFLVHKGKRNCIFHPILGVDKVYSNKSVEYLMNRNVS